MCGIELKFNNEKINMPITSTKGIGLIGGLILLFDIIIFSYVKKNS